MNIRQGCLTVATPGRGLTDITAPIVQFVGNSGIQSGLLTIFMRHTSAGLIIQENADPDVLADLNDFLNRLIPDDPCRYRHIDEGPDDMPAHIRAVLTATHLSVPVAEGKMLLGLWQGIYVFEHRIRPHCRDVVLHMSGH